MQGPVWGGEEKKELSAQTLRERGVDEWVGWVRDRESGWMSGWGGIEIEGWRGGVG